MSLYTSRARGLLPRALPSQLSPASSTPCLPLHAARSIHASLASPSLLCTRPRHTTSQPVINRQSFSTMPQTTIHDAATQGFHNASAYDAHRPSYFPEAVEKVLTNLAVAGPKATGTRIVDLAAGTGKMTELLAARPEELTIVAVEPHAEMRATLEAKKLPRVESRPGTADSMAAVADGWADAVIVAQAFHWFANEPALAEIHRTLKPEGKFAVIWNIEDYNKPPAWKAATQWEQNLNDLILSIARDGQPRFRDYKWKDVFDTARAKSLFDTPIAEDSVEWTIWLTPDALWERVLTLSQVAVLEGKEAADFRARFDDFVANGDARRNDKGEVAVHGNTHFAWTTKL